MYNDMNTYGISHKGEYVEVSNSLLGAKQYATRNGYTEVYIRYNGGMIVTKVSEKINNNKWSF